MWLLLLVARSRTAERIDKITNASPMKGNAIPAENSPWTTVHMPSRNCLLCVIVATGCAKNCGKSRKNVTLAGRPTLNPTWRSSEWTSQKQCCLLLAGKITYQMVKTAQKSAFSKFKFKKTFYNMFNGEFSKSTELISFKLSTRTTDGL